MSSWHKYAHTHTCTRLQFPMILLWPQIKSAYGMGAAAIIRIRTLCHANRIIFSALFACSSRVLLKYLNKLTALKRTRTKIIGSSNLIGFQWIWIWFQRSALNRMLVRRDVSLKYQLRIGVYSELKTYEYAVNAKMASSAAHNSNQSGETKLGNKTWKKSKIVANIVIILALLCV